jgi:hypothetical protein
VIHELLAPTAATEKLGARAILMEEAQQLLDNRYVIVRSLRRPRGAGTARPRADGWAPS